MSEMVRVVINEIEIEVKKGTTILDAATLNGIEIPTLCYLVGVSDVGMCRLCMVEVEGYESFLPACRSKCVDGMVITTESEKLTEYRREILNLLLANHKFCLLRFLELRECGLWSLGECLEKRWFCRLRKSCSKESRH